MALSIVRVNRWQIFPVNQQYPAIAASPLVWFEIRRRRRPYDGGSTVLRPCNVMSDPNLVPPKDSSPTKWVALGCGGCALLSLLLVGAIALLVGRTTRFAFGPERVEANGNALFTYTMPGESKGIFDMRLFGLEITQITSTDSPPSVLLTMGKLPRYLQGRSEQQAAIESFQDQITVEGSYQFTEQRTEERTLCGQPVAVLIQSGQFEEGTKTYNATSLLTTVEYRNSNRFVWILAHGEAAQQNADQVFDSLACQ